MELFNTQVAVENLGPLLAGLLMTVELTFVVILLSLVFAWSWRSAACRAGGRCAG